MKRGYTALEYKEQGARACARCGPTSAISSDFIVGFPGESERDFEATLALVREVGFDQSFSFIYSRRPGTPAASLPGRGAARRQASSAWRGCRRSSTRRRAHQRAHGRQLPARAGGAAGEEGRARARRAHREQPLGELRRARRAASAASPM